MARDRPRAAPVSESVGHDAEASLWSERSWGGALRWRRAGPAALEPAARLGRGPIGAARPPGRAAAWGGRLGPPDPQRPAPAAGGRPNRRRPSHRQRARPSSARGVSRRTGRTSQREDRGRRPADTGLWMPAHGRRPCRSRQAAGKSLRGPVAPAQSSAGERSDDCGRLFDSDISPWAVRVASNVPASGGPDRKREAAAGPGGGRQRDAAICWPPAGADPHLRCRRSNVLLQMRAQRNLVQILLGLT